jgi:hypothetical protein
MRRINKKKSTVTKPLQKVIWVDPFCSKEEEDEVDNDDDGNSQ